ncbi:hypothetical protein PV10_03801 [Exophiala mesophila]|uniref:Major facilitator superfamily (MFS) profile domain-containing protein n=1 Tax=Exophiala mesophila TaxID=212818 RepID=A0A0D1WTJ7_EXOME|nr:uncharacterized protein PV10_03801 [Exophiala mesophila]KIV92510.1 hypothetical protein PV10_03801 [Exophiala mesophila]
MPQPKTNKPSLVHSTSRSSSQSPGPSSPSQATETTRLLSKRKPSDQAALAGHDNHEVHHRGPISSARFKFLFISILLNCIIAFFDSTLMASAHPVITSYFNASNAASWFSTVFYLTSTVFQPLYGRISDTIGRRPVYLFAITMFFCSTAWCGSAPDLGNFIAARAVCGMGAGGVTTMAGILTSDLVKIEYRGIYQSYFNMAYGFGIGIGAALGGFLCDHFGWRMAFYLQLPFILVFGCLAYIAVPKGLGPNLAKTRGTSLGSAFSSFDSYGAVGLSTMTTCLILGVNLGGNVFNWTHPLVITSLVLFIISAVALYFIERGAEYPILPIPYLSTKPNGNLMWSNFFAAIVINTVLFNIPLYLQAVRQTTPTTSGIFLLSPLFGISITAVLVGYYITYTRKMKGPMTIGTIILIMGIVLVTACLSPEVPTWAVPLLIPFCSIGQGFLFPAVTISVLAINPQDEQAVVGTTLGLLRNLGSILGVAVSSWLVQNALIVFLDSYVTAADPQTKAAIIRTVRESVQAIRHLDPEHKTQVIAAYNASLRFTFLVIVVVAIFPGLLIWPLKIPRLQSQTDMDSGGLDGAGDDEPIHGLLDARDQVAVQYDDNALLDVIDEEAGSGDTDTEADDYAIDDSGTNASLSRTNSRTSRTMSHASASAAGRISRRNTNQSRSRRASFDLQWR